MQHRLGRSRFLQHAIDLRIGSPTFGAWDSVLLDAVDRRAIYLAEGLGHAFVALEDDSTVSYLVSDVYNPTAEHGVLQLSPGPGHGMTLSPHAAQRRTG